MVDTLMTVVNSNLGDAAQTAANAYMLETISGIVISVIMLIFIIHAFNKF